ncbi:cold shock domain-containing protein [Streptomyces sp. NBC_01304]|uniref:cold shock domain-containing protein n=1 Tax=Streptomyces sp. NBC_01304 TaxID=2903818 RepID=UPI002E13C848|nr:cold shock domain-containing protein [Streptomyces sp. NBC_01304]
MSARCTGFVQFFNRRDGYGFIVPVGQRDPVFVHGEDIEHQPQVLSEGQQVTFCLELGQGRFEARKVRP